MCCDIPIDVLDPEIIIRAIKTPHHINTKKKRLRPAAFRPQYERDDVSVMRLNYMGADACKMKAKEISGDEYIGLAALTAEEIRRTGADVIDSREEFCGHAHISQGEPMPRKGETVPPRLQAQYKALSDIARSYFDPDPDTLVWIGPALA